MRKLSPDDYQGNWRRRDCCYPRVLATGKVKIPGHWENAAVWAFDVHDGFKRGEETLVAAQDLETAYNWVTYKKLMAILINIKGNPVLNNWI